MRASTVIKVFLVLAALGCFASSERGDIDKLPILARFDFEDGTAKGWQPKNLDHWRVVKHGGSLVYELAAPGEQGKVRAPTSWSVIAGCDVTSFVFTGRLKCYAEASNPHRDLCIFFLYQDPTHFYYVHFSASSDEAHNIIGLVNGSDRVKVNHEPAGKSVFRLLDSNWHTFKVTCDDSSGKIQAFLDDMENPILTAVDTTFHHGLVGVGSFDDTGCFDDLILRGEKHERR